HVRGADDDQRAGQGADRPPAGGLHGVLRFAEPRRHPRTGEELMAAPKIGAKVKDFTAASTDGGEFRLGDAAGKVVVLYFYPKDMTSGCTTESRDFRDL